MSNDKIIITKTNDGYVVELFAKIKNNVKNEVKEVAEGVSVLEIKKNQTEEEQFLIYKKIVEEMEDNPVTIKAIEKGKDILALKTQIRAILRAALCGDLSIAFSKIASVTDLIEIKEILEECKNELEKEDKQYKKHIKIGTVVEIPSAALMSYEIARECDFLFIETNNLTNYIFGGKYDASEMARFQPAIIKLIRFATKGAHDAGIYCGICGDIAENALYIPLLIGLGIDEFSIEQEKISNIRKIINGLERYECKELAEEVLQMRSIEEIEKRIRQF